MIVVGLHLTGWQFASQLQRQYISFNVRFPHLRTKFRRNSRAEPLQSNVTIILHLVKGSLSYFTTEERDLVADCARMQREPWGSRGLSFHQKFMDLTVPKYDGISFMSSFPRGYLENHREYYQPFETPEVLHSETPSCIFRQEAFICWNCRGVKGSLSTSRLVDSLVSES